MYILKKIYFYCFILNCIMEKLNIVFLDVCILRDYDLCIYILNLFKFFFYYILSLKEIDL